MVERKINAFLGIAFISMTILSYEVLLSRLFSVFIGNPFAYYPISLAFLGMSCAGLYIYLFPRKFIQGDITKPLFYISMLLCIFLTMGTYFFYYITNVFTKKSLDIIMGGSILKGLDYYYTRGVGVSVIGGLILTIPFFSGRVMYFISFQTLQ